MLRVVTLGLILAALVGIVFAVGIALAAPRAESMALHIELIEPHEQAASRAEQVAKALVLAYPQRVLMAEFRQPGGDRPADWAVLLRDTWFYYAEGRMLPEEYLDRAHEYSPIAFYNYPAEMPPWTAPTAEQGRQLSERSSERATSQPPRAPFFFETLYRSRNRDEAYQRVKTIRFLGHQIMVHSSILEVLSLVEEQIQAAARTDAQVRSWVNNINNMSGWTWRTMVGSQSRSFHAYGVAIDILPRSPGGREIFWQWAGPTWWSVPYEGRYHPPEAVIRAFESYGFVWGGKWLFFDTMHFEYRPEVFFMNGMGLSGLR